MPYFGASQRSIIAVITIRNSSKEIKSGKGGRKGGRSKKAAEEPLSYVISISPYRGCYRHVRVCADITLDDLHNMIQEIFGFANDHLYAFFMDNKAWSDWDVYLSHRSRQKPGPVFVFVLVLHI